MRRIPRLETGPKVWQILGPALYTQRPLMAITMRELFQNARDACLGQPRPMDALFHLSTDSDFTAGTLTCRDNGCGMDEDTLLDRFFVLGESLKAPGSTGGWGIAKATILGGCCWWEVKTQNVYVSLDHLEERRPIDTLPPEEEIMGTEIRLRYDALHRHDPRYNKIGLSRYKLAEGLSLLAHSDSPCTITLSLCEDGQKPTQYQRELEGLRPSEEDLLYKVSLRGTSVAIYQVDSLSILPVTIPGKGRYAVDSKGFVFYRLNGLAQFSRYFARHPDVFVVDITTQIPPGGEGYPFTPSREQVSEEVRSIVREALEAHKENPLTSASCRRHRKGTEKRDTLFYPGQWWGEKGEEPDRKAQDMVGVAQGFTSSPGASLRSSSLMEGGSEPHLMERSPLGVSLFFKGLSSTRRNLFAPHNLRLLSVWGKVVRMVLEASSIHEQFGIGFVFDTDFLAERLVNEKGVFYLLNPSHHRIKVSRPHATLWAMFLHATHEITHSSEEHHSEHFTNWQSQLYLEALEALLRRERSLVRELSGRAPSARERSRLPAPGWQAALPGLE